MALHYWSINRGQLDNSLVASATSAPTADVIVTLDLTKNLTKLDLMTALELISEYLLKDTYPSNAGGPGDT